MPVRFSKLTKALWSLIDLPHLPTVFAENFRRFAVSPALRKNLPSVVFSVLVNAAVLFGLALIQRAVVVDYLSH